MLVVSVHVGAEYDGFMHVVHDVLELHVPHRLLHFTHVFVPDG